MQLCHSASSGSLDFQTKFRQDAESIIQDGPRKIIKGGEVFMPKSSLPTDGFEGGCGVRLPCLALPLCARVEHAGRAQKLELEVSLPFLKH